MGKHKQEFFKDLFTDESIGADLGNCEVKFSNKIKPQWSLRNIDLETDFLVFYSEQNFFWYFLKIEDLPKIKHRKSTIINEKYKWNYAESFAKKYSYFQTTDIEESMNEFEKIVLEPKKYLN